jgi:hypothetical protein
MIIILVSQFLMMAGWGYGKAEENSGDIKRENVYVAPE